MKTVTIIYVISVTIGMIALVIVATALYVKNIFDVFGVEKYQQPNVPNIVCGIGILVPPVGMVCGAVR